jgi:CHAT domain-containing protein
LSHPATAITLYNTLVAPLTPYLNTPHLIIVPHQGLHYVPFSALTNGERYLMDDFAITYLPNASMLQFLPSADHIPAYDTALILGNPTTGGTDEFGNVLTSLPGAAQSAQAIASLFNTSPLLGSTATEAVVRESVPNANILHMGVHARFNTVAPLQSALYLTPGQDSTDVSNDGRLQVDEVFGLPFNDIELVMLSACETNLGYLDRDNPLSNISAGDELVSLNRAFLFHAPTVISTLWTVDDAATGLLMEQFYIHLLDGKSKADALRLAQLNVREQYPNPYFWAGFILSGDGGEIEPSLTQIQVQPVEPVTITGTKTESEPEDAMIDSETDVDGSRFCLGSIILLLIISLTMVWKRPWLKSVKLRLF